MLIALLIIALLGYIAWSVLSFPSLPIKDSTRLTYESFVMQLEAMKAAREMVNEAIRHQHSFSERRKMPWEE
jgi:predicted negative regulator of RcsB-dependent stress response